MFDTERGFEMLYDLFEHHHIQLKLDVEKYKNYRLQFLFKKSYHVKRYEYWISDSVHV